MKNKGLFIFKALLRLYPGEFRDEYGREMSLVLSDRYHSSSSAAQRAFISLEACTAVLVHAPREHLSILFRDSRHALRLLLKSPIFALTAILSLALGIGANTAIFAVANQVLFEELPVKYPQQLRMLTWTSGHQQPVPPVWGDVSATKEGGLISTAFSYPVLQQFRKTGVFQDLIAFKDTEVTATVEGHPELVAAEMLSGNAFRALGVRTILGRALTQTDDSGLSGNPAVAISEIYWTEKFGRSESVLNASISINGVPVTIVGVVAAPFTGLTLGTVTRLFVPLTAQPLLMPRAQKIGANNLSLLENPQSWWVIILGRLRPDISEARAEATLDTVLRQTAAATLPDAKGLDQLRLKLQAGDRGLDYLRGLAKPSYVLLALSCLVLLLACANLANLLLARATGRQREMSIRLALGAGRPGILRQLLTESLLLSFLGGAAALPLAYLGRNLIPRLLAKSPNSPLANIDFDWRTLLFTAGVSVLTGLFFGLAPAWQATRADINEGLKDSSRATFGRRRSWMSKGLVVFQISLSTILLLAAGLFVQTLANLNNIPLGFHADHLLLFKLVPPRTRYADQPMIALYRLLEKKLAVIPGVQSVTLSNIALIGDGHSGSTFHPSGRPVKQEPDRVQTNGVGADFFQTMGIPVIQGRGFNQHDNAKTAKVAVINRALARQFFRDENPIGQTFDCDEVSGLVQIVGIAADTRYADLRSPTPPTFYIPYQQADIGSRMIVEIRTFADPFSVLHSVRSVVASVDRDLPLIDVRTQEQQVQTTLSSEKTFSELTAGFGILALVLATIGIYGLMAYTVARRSGEIGIRMALGARMGQTLFGVLSEALSLALIGIALGIGVSLWMARFIGTMLYGLQPSDPLTIAAISAILIAVALFASFGPARQASRIDPVSALRHE